MSNYLNILDFYSPYSIAGFILYSTNSPGTWTDAQWNQLGIATQMVGLIAGNGEIFILNPSLVFDPQYLAFYRFSNRGLLISIESTANESTGIFSVVTTDSNQKAYTSTNTFVYQYQTSFTFAAPPNQCITKLGLRFDFGPPDGGSLRLGRPVYDSTANIPTITTSLSNPIQSHKGKFVGYMTSVNNPGSLIGFYDVDNRVCNFTDETNLTANPFPSGYYLAGFSVYPQLNGSRLYSFTLMNLLGSLTQLTASFFPDQRNFQFTTTLDTQYILGTTVDTFTYLKLKYDQGARTDFMILSVQTIALPQYTGSSSTIARNNPGSAISGAFTPVQFPLQMTNPNLNIIPAAVRLTAAQRVRRRFDGAIVSLVTQIGTTKYIGMYQPQFALLTGAFMSSYVQFVNATGFIEPQLNVPSGGAQQVAQFKLNFTSDTSFQLLQYADIMSQHNSPPLFLYANTSSYTTVSSFHFVTNGNNVLNIAADGSNNIVSTNFMFLDASLAAISQPPVYVNILTENAYTTLLQTNTQLLSCCNPAGIDADITTARGAAQIQLCADNDLIGYAVQTNEPPTQPCIDVFNVEKLLDMSNLPIQSWCLNNSAVFGTECENRYKNFCQVNDENAQLMGSTCSCFMNPATVYTPYFTKLASSLGVTIPTNGVNPVCNYPPCVVLGSNSGLGVTPYNPPTCPSIVECIQIISVSVGADGTLVGNLSASQKQVCGVTDNTGGDTNPPVVPPTQVGTVNLATIEYIAAGTSFFFLIVVLLLLYALRRKSSTK